MVSSTRTLFGIHAAQAALSKTPEKALQVYLESTRKDKRLNELRAECGRLGIPIQEVARKQLDKLSNSSRHQGVVLSLALPEELNEEALQASVKNAGASAFYLILDRVQDPHNLGACLRTADAAGVSGVVVPKDQAARLTPTVCKVACGAAETVPLYRVTNLARTLRWMKQEGVWMIGADGEAEKSLFQIDFSGPIAVIIGAEGEGMRRLTREECDHVASLPMMGQVESLNLSVATALFLYEAVRQRTGS